MQCFDYKSRKSVRKVVEEECEYYHVHRMWWQDLAPHLLIKCSWHAAKKVYWMKSFTATALGFTLKGNRKWTYKGDIFLLKASFIERRKPLFWISSLLTAILEAYRSNKTSSMISSTNVLDLKQEMWEIPHPAANIWMIGCMMDKYCQHRVSFIMKSLNQIVMLQ